MTVRRLSLLLLLLLPLLLPACATGKEKRFWQPGDSIICPHCGREFRVPEKLGE